MPHISELEKSFIPWVKTGYEKMGWGNDEGYFEICLEQQKTGELIVLISHDDTSYFGHLKLVWEPEYPEFRKNNIPELKDLNVIPDMRRQGIATELIARAEHLASTKCKTIGISVGLHYWYGPAQRLYAKRAYIPDGQGICFHKRSSRSRRHCCGQ